jgi:hypothetical protein
LVGLTGTRVLSFESLPKDAPYTVRAGDLKLTGHVWKERIETNAEVRASFEDRSPAYVVSGKFHYFAFWPDAASWIDLLRNFFDLLRIPYTETGADLRLVSAQDVMFAFNYGPDTEDLTARRIGPSSKVWLMGSADLSPGGVAVWKSG